MGRPSKFTEAIADAICEDIIAGKSLRSICGMADMPDRTTVLRWLTAEDSFTTKYTRARILQADALEEEMSDIEDKTLTGEIDAAAARTVLASKQWRAAKLAPKRYGDKLELSGSADSPLVIIKDFTGSK